MSQVELHHGAATDVGLLRETNEDAYLVAPPVFVVADGMGGHADGGVASRIVVEEFARLADEGYDPVRGTEVIAATLEASQRRITEFAAEGDGSAQSARSPGTTVVAALLVEDDGAPAWLLANLGDSRIYRVADGVLEQVSTDHSVVQELIDSGKITEEQAAGHPERHVITRALGGPRLENAPTTSCSPCSRPNGCCSAPTASADWSTTRRSPPSSPRAPTRATPPTGWSRPPSRPVETTTRPRSWSMWWDWCPNRPTTPSNSGRVSSRNWGHCRERTR